MRALSIAGLLTLLLIGGCMAGYKLAFPTYTYRYRMTIEVMVNGKIHSGSSVIEVSLTKQPQFLIPTPPVWPNVIGEAVFVDLGNGRNVIALLTSGPNARGVNFAQHVVPAHFHLSYSDKDLVQYPQLKGGWQLDPALLPSIRLPTLVTFNDLNDPKTARIVRPDEFPRVFGADIRPPKITIEMTEASVTRRLFRELPWLVGFKGYSGGQFQPDWSRPEKNLTAMMFMRA